MKDDHYEFTAVAIMAALAILCTVGMGVLIVADNVTKDNSFGIEGIVEALKLVTASLVGGLITLTKSSVTTSAAVPQEKQP